MLQQSVWQIARLLADSSPRMRQVLGGIALAGCLLAPVAHAGKPAPKCSEIAVKWTIDSWSGYNLQGVGAPYDGTLLICGSGDITMNLTQTNRYVMNVTNPLIAQNADSPAWAITGASFLSQPFLNVRSVLGVTVDQRGPNNTLPADDYTLTTHFGGSFSGLDGKAYHFRWANTTGPLPGTTEHVLPRCGDNPVQCSAWVNAPLMTAKVKVEYTALTKTWVITPDESEVDGGHSGIATLYFLKKNTNINAGQFGSFRFRFVVQAQ